MQKVSRRGCSSGVTVKNQPSASGEDTTRADTRRRSNSVASAIKDAVNGVPSASVPAPARPSSRGSNARRRPVPKSMKEDARQTPEGELAAPSSALRPSGTTGRSSVEGERATPTSARRSSAASGRTGDAGKPEMPSAALNFAKDNPHCSISTDGDGPTEIRTKVFRIGAPLLRSTIPVALGRSPTASSLGEHMQSVDREDPESRYKVMDNDEDVETVLSLSDVEVEDQGSLSVTLDFPC